MNPCASTQVSGSDWAELQVWLNFEAAGFVLEYEPDFGGKHPDFLVKDGSETELGLIEVESVTVPMLVEGTVVATEPIAAVREKIKAAARQLKGGKHLPCMLVVDARESMQAMRPEHFSQAMLGTDQVTVTMYSDGSTAIQPTRANDGKMVRPTHLTPQNTTISAIAQMRVFVAAVELDDSTWDGTTVHMDKLPDWAQNLCQIGHTCQPETLQGKRFFVMQAERLHVVRNPDARKPWTEEMLNPWSTVYEVGADRRTLKIIHDGPTLHGVPVECRIEDFPRMSDDNLFERTLGQDAFAECD